MRPSRKLREAVDRERPEFKGRRFDYVIYDEVADFQVPKDMVSTEVDPVRFNIDAMIEAGMRRAVAEAEKKRLAEIWRTRDVSAVEQWHGDGYCIKCKDKRTTWFDVHVTNGRRLAKSRCPECGTKLNRILGKVNP